MIDRTEAQWKARTVLQLMLAGARNPRTLEAAEPKLTREDALDGLIELEVLGLVARKELGRWELTPPGRRAAEAAVFDPQAALADVVSRERGDR